MSNHELVMQTFKSAAEYIARLKNAIGNIAELLQSGRENMALSLLEKLPEGIEWLIQVKQLTGAINLKYGMDVKEDALKNVLTQIVDAQANKDYVTIADCLEYELQPVMEQYEKELERILGQYN